MEDRYNEIRTYVNNKLEIIDKINDCELKSSCLFILLECFAQEYGNYSRNNNREVFSNFLNTFLDKCLVDELNLIDPITLYYSCEKLRGAFCLDDCGFLDDSYVYAPNQMRKQCSNILESCDSCVVNCSKRKTHRYIDLLYTYRNKLSHEMKAPAYMLKPWNDHEHISYFYISKFNIDANTGSSLDDIGFWNLIFPYKYLKNLFSKAIMSYVAYCENKSVDPFINDKKTGKNS